MRQGMATVITPRILIDECVHLGIDRAELIADAGIPHDSIYGTAGCIPVDQVFALWESILRFSPDPMLAVHTAEKVPFGTYNVLDYILATSSFPKDALERSSRAFSLVNSAFQLSFRMRHDFGYLELYYPQNPKCLPRPYVEYIFANYLLRLRSATRTSICPAEIQVTYMEPKIADAYERVFNAPFRFGQSINRMIFSRHCMEIPHALADPELCELLEGYAQRRLRDVVGYERRLAEIRHVMIHNLENGDVSLPRVSRQLARSTRSLQRELHASGTTFHELLANVRRERALELLRDFDLPLAQVASQLKFSGMSAFCRAFQGWTGRAPREYRKQLQNRL